MKQLLLSLGTLLIASSAMATVIYVNPNSTGNDDGTSWTDAYESLNDALGAAVDTDTLWVAEGFYQPSTDSTRSDRFLINANIHLFGGFSGNETDLNQRDWVNNPTILDGDLYKDDNSNIDPDEPLRSDNSLHVVVIGSYVSTTTIDGFTISGGNANTSAWPDNQGAGIFVGEQTGNVKIVNCKFINNSSTGASPAIRTKFIVDEYREFSLENCIVAHNTSSNAPVAITITDGSMSATVANCLFENNAILDNSVQNGTSGSALSFYTTSSDIMDAVMINCTVVNNTEGGTDIAEGTPIIAAGGGNTLNFVAANNLIDNNTGATNSFGTRSFGCPTSVELYNNIRTDNDSLYCGGTANGEFYNAPQLDANLIPLQTSPAVDAGNNTYSIGSVDYYGTDRVVNGTVDIGAFEYDSGALEIEEENNFKISLYPNPTNGQVVIQSDELIIDVKVLNLSGKMVDLDWNQGQIDFTGYPAGIYFIQVQSRTKMITKRIIKQ